MPTPGKINESPATTGQSWKQYAAGGPYSLVSDSPDGATCAREVRLLAAGDLTACYLPDGTTNRPLTGLPSGYVHAGPVSSVTPTVAIVVYW